MGYMRHEALILVVTSKRAVAAIDAVLVGVPDSYKRFVVGPVEGINGQRIYAVLPDGSKEGWPESDAVQSIRDQLIEALPMFLQVDGIYVNFGGDDRGDVTTRLLIPWEDAD